MGMLLKALLWVVVVLGAGVWGCAKKDGAGGPGEPVGGQDSSVNVGKPGNVDKPVDAPGERGTAGGAAAAAQAGAFEAALKLWRAGDKEAAARQFMVMDWANSAVFAEGSVFRISEEEFVKLLAGRRTAVQEEAMNTTREVREIARYVVEKGKALAAQGQPAAAKPYYDAVARCGEALAGKDKLAIVQLMGQALQKYAAAQTGG